MSTINLPPQGFYRETIRDAVRYWNEFAKALNALRRRNNWRVAQALREGSTEGKDGGKANG